MLQFAQLGRFYAENVLGVNNPRIALLNNGTEEDKGDRLHKEVHQQLKAQGDLNFVGNVEASASGWGSRRNCLRWVDGQCRFEGYRRDRQDDVDLN